MHTTTVKGVAVPSLGYGTWRLTGEDCVRGVADALDVGYRHVDTAQAYGNEVEVGEAIARSGVDRGDVFLTTKLTGQSLDPEPLRRSVDESLRKLRTGYLDLLLIHWPREGMDHAATIGTMMSLADEGKVRHVGVSNYPPSLFDDASKVADIFCNQVEYHPYLSQDRLQRMAVERDFLLTAYSPLARGRVFDDETIAEVAEEHGTGPSQVVLRWLIQQDHVAAIPKSTSREHIAANFAAHDIELSDEEMARIGSLGREERLVDPGFAPDWER